jgi:signal peptidase II
VKRGRSLKVIALWQSGRRFAITTAWVVALIVLLDQVTKAAVIAHIPYLRGVEVTSFFNLVHVRNTGAAFSFLAHAGGWQRVFFIVLTIAAIALMLHLLRRHWQERWFAAGVVLVLAGAIGNLIDRVRFGYVVDFFDFHLAGWHFWAFNVADSAITVGAIMLIIDSFRPRPPA